MYRKNAAMKVMAFDFDIKAVNDDGLFLDTVLSSMWWIATTKSWRAHSSKASRKRGLREDVPCSLAASHR